MVSKCYGNLIIYVMAQCPIGCRLWFKRQGSHSAGHMDHMDHKIPPTQERGLRGRGGGPENLFRPFQAWK